MYLYVNLNNKIFSAFYCSIILYKSIKFAKCLRIHNNNDIAVIK